MAADETAEESSLLMLLKFFITAGAFSTKLKELKEELLVRSFITFKLSY